MPPEAEETIKAAAAEEGSRYPPGSPPIVPAAVLAQAWRLAHLAQYRTSRPWMIPAADLVVDTTVQNPSAVARQIADAISGL